MTWVEIWRWLFNQILGRAATPSVPEGGVSGGVAIPIGSTGYSVEGERKMDIEKLRTLCDELIIDYSLKPREGKTYCNFAIQKAAHEFGSSDFDDDLGHPLLANAIIEKLSIGLPDWREDSAERAVAHAMKGGLAIAGHEYAGHGHVAVVAPREMEESGSYGKPVPMLANVGQRNDYIKMSEAFAASKGEPQYWLYGETA